MLSYKILDDLVLFAIKSKKIYEEMVLFSTHICEQHWHQSIKKAQSIFNARVTLFNENEVQI